MKTFEFKELKPPVFIFGNPRSGTTLLRLMLNAHPTMVVAPECGFAQWLYKDYGAWEEKFVDDEKKVKGFIESLFATRKFETWGLEKSKVASIINEYRPQDYSALVSLVYYIYGKTKRNNFERWGDKNNYYINHIGLLYSLFPNAFSVLIVRDGRDVACSYRELGRKDIKSPYRPKLPTAIDEIATEWSLNNLTAIDSLKKYSKGNYYVVKYENLVRKNKQALKGICQFLGVPYSDKMLSYHLSTKSSEPEEFIKWKKKTLHQPVTTQIGRYKKELVVEEIRLFEKIAEAQLKNHNYI